MNHVMDHGTAKRWFQISERRDAASPQLFIAFMDTNSATAQDHLLKAIDDEIKVAERVSQQLKSRHNALVPISRLPPETLVEIFSLLRFPPDDSKYVPSLKWICVTHVCSRWREVALSSPCLWNHINFTKLTLLGFTEILARAKMSPLHIEAKITPRRKTRFNALRKQLEAHISHTRHLSISGKFWAVLTRLISPAPALVSLSLTGPSYSYVASQLEYNIPNSLFNGTAPKLTRLELLGCSIGWQSPLLKGLQTLKIRTPYAQATPTLEDWLAALEEIPQLKSLILDNATPAVSVDNSHIPEPQRTVTLPSLTHFNITASTKGCALALAHLVLPALISLHVTSESQSWDGDDVRLLIPYVVRTAHGPQDTAPLQTILVNGGDTEAEIVTWTVPDADDDVCDPVTLNKAAVSARLVLVVTSDSECRDAMETVVFDALLSHLPLNAISTLSVQNETRLSKELWLSHAPRLTELNRVLLVSTAIRAFREMLEEDAPPDGRPRLPQLTKLILCKVSLTLPRTRRLCDMLVKRKEDGAPLEALNLRTCIGPERSFRLLSEIVGNVQGPAKNPRAGDSALFNGEVSPFDEEEERIDEEEECTDYDEYDDGPGFWHGSTDEGDEEEDEDEEDESDDYNDD